MFFPQVPPCDFWSILAYPRLAIFVPNNGRTGVNDEGGGISKGDSVDSGAFGSLIRSQLEGDLYASYC